MLCRGDSSKWNVLYFPIHEGLNSDKRRIPSIKTYTNIDLALRTVEIFDFSKNYIFLGPLTCPDKNDQILIVDNKTNSVFDLLKKAWCIEKFPFRVLRILKRVFHVKTRRNALDIKNNFHTVKIFA